jgi:hypothetical protein
MLLLDKNMTPVKTIYFLAATAYGILLKQGGLDYSELYLKLSNQISKTKINNDSYMLSLDFLFLLDKIFVDKRGKLYVYKKTNFKKKLDK